ncbi:MAG: ArgE/DapE family deacylase [bacterium]|nr:ArgE/DapE family deacylase [bacterium]
MTKDIKSKIIREIDRTKSEQIAFLQKLVQTNSVNPYIEDPLKSSPYEPVELAVADLIFKKLESVGLKPKLVGLSPKRPNVVCQLGSGSKTIIFNGHMDTISPSRNYDFDPFAGLIRKGKLWGVGALDMKSALACYVFMAKAILKFADKLKGNILLQFVVDEEPMAASGFGTSYLLKKGYLGDAAIIGEPGSHKITIGNRGGYRFRLEVFGKAVHSGSREWEQKKEGKNAILEMAKAIAALQDLKLPDKNFPVFPGRKNVFTFPTTISGGKAINIVPDYCSALGDVRTLPGITQKAIESKMKIILGKTGIKYRLTPIVYVPSVFVKEKEPIVQALKKNAEKVLNKKLYAEGSGPWSDVWMFIKNGIPAINFGCKGNGMHGKNEYVEIKSLFEVTKIYALTTIDFLK